MMEIQKQLLLFMSGIHSGFLNLLVQVFTIFGEEFLLIAISVFIYWNINKKNGFVISMSLMNALSVMGIAKAIVRFPRPWMVIDNLETVRQHTATGYSFPSGHTTCAASTYSAIAMTFRKRWLSILCAVAILLVALSRMYLCVHWPMDVVGGLLIGCGTTFIFGGVFSRTYDDKDKSIRLTTAIGCVMTLATIVLSIVLMTGKGDALAFDDLCVSFAVYGGLAFGFSIERRYIDFDINEGEWGKKILRYVIGLAVVGLILYGGKVLLQAIGFYNYLTRALRYFVIGLWCCTYPMLGKKLRLF